MKLSKITGMGINISTNNKKIAPHESFYSLTAKANNREMLLKDEIKIYKNEIVKNRLQNISNTPE